MPNKIHYVSQESLDKMKEELSQLKSTGRTEIARAIAEAREKGDLKENAEYDAAKDAQGVHEAKIARLENTISTARVIDKASIDTSKVSVLTHVTILNERTKKEAVYYLVSEKEADIKEGKLSVDSPIGRGLLGKVVGETAKVQTPGGVITFKVLRIER